MVQYKEVFDLAVSKGMKHLPLLCEFHNISPAIIDNEVNELLILTLIQFWLRNEKKIDIMQQDAIRGWIQFTIFKNSGLTSNFENAQNYNEALLKTINAALQLL